MIHLIYDVFYGNATDPAMRVRETRDEVTGQVIYEDYYTGERVFLFAGDAQLHMQAISDAQSSGASLLFQSNCETSLTVIHRES